MTIAERAALNQSTFRDANERIEAGAESLDEVEAVPFICECPTRDCTAVALLLLAEYEEIRQRGERFWVVPGHETTNFEGVEIAVVVDRGARFSIMDKIGKAGEVARQEDPRANGA